ncbi:MAG: tRNA (adenosine(37)-N6)-threonylcarbamoyltransferase complex ATPase subunit type 1 TsaE [Bacteroidetes bacterium]|nr:tRNA (adenosine(37)-N6)-threonylcarbamoyltransferase complex ATPase subunit type 1 TsaE [Bacteroidota bacterium]
MQELSFSYKVADIDAAAAWVREQAGEVRVWLFIGEMGAGKTTLIKAICRQLGTTDDLSSPTYALVNEYAIPGQTTRIYHLDLYRLRDIQEALDIGIEDYLLGGDYCLIEWPQIIEPLLREGEYLTIHISPVSEYERKISIFKET